MKLETAIDIVTKADSENWSSVTFIPSDLLAILKSHERMRKAMVEAALPLEALRYSELDGSALCDSVKKGILEGTEAVRAALAAAPK